MDRLFRNAVHHYNIDYRIYRLFLDSDLQYSCAYFENRNASLDDATRPPEGVALKDSA
jgi:cyclopropane-fatty-acyl-phospholipid synthase